MSVGTVNSLFNAQPKQTRGGETRKPLSAQPERTSQRLIQSIYKGGGRRLRDAERAKTAYLEPNRNTMQKPIGGLSVLNAFQSKNNTTINGNVYNPKSSFPKDAKRKHNGTSKKTRSKTRITRLFAQATRQTPRSQNPLLAKNNRRRA